MLSTLGWIFVVILTGYGFSVLAFLLNGCKKLETMQDRVISYSCASVITLLGCILCWQTIPIYWIAGLGLFDILLNTAIILALRILPSDFQENVRKHILESKEGNSDA